MSSCNLTANILFSLKSRFFLSQNFFRLLSWCMVRWTVHLKKFLWPVLLIVEKLHHHFSPLCLTRLLSVRECIFVFALSKSLLFKIFQTLLIFLNFFKRKIIIKVSRDDAFWFLAHFFFRWDVLSFSKTHPFRTKPRKKRFLKTHCGSVLDCIGFP